ncbi:lactococcin 972 family bacteriocin [Streptomyces vinaceus]|uniref:lactococcin 972 family bacteriocin n=1 Tax=Streptomyces vinaceus TaxID=1960 RepID=UPI0035DF58E3
MALDSTGALRASTSGATVTVHQYCYSNYAHETKGHASTVKLAGDTRRVHAAAGDVSNANLTAGLAYTCSTYYSVD